MKHLETHPEPQPDCFACKLQSINWGIVPGGYKDSNSYDKDALKEMNLPSKQEIMDYRSDYKNAPEKEIKIENQPVYSWKGRRGSDPLR